MFIFEYTRQANAARLFNDVMQTIKEEAANLAAVDASMPKQIITNNNATVFFWKDGTKTVVRRSEKDEDSVIDAYYYAMLKKYAGSSSKAIAFTEHLQRMYETAKESETTSRNNKARKAAKKADRKSHKPDNPVTA